MTEDQKQQIKLAIKKAVFSGNSFINNVKNLENITDQYTTTQLMQVTEEDEEIYNLLSTLELLREQLEEMV